MATPATPSTPAAQKEVQATPTGRWIHPKFDEITRRQHAAVFDERNVSQIVWNGGFLLASYFISPSISRWALLRTLTSPLFGLAKTWTPYSSYIIYAIRLLFIINIIQALWPLFRRYRPDPIADIPLTPSQRQAMGLDPNVSTPQTPGSIYSSPQYITPPRYAKSTPRSSLSNQSDRKPSHSPLSGSPRAGLAKSTSNSPFSPNTGSPLLHKAVGGGSATRRLSYDSRNSPLASSFFGESSASNTPGTPTPGMGKASVGLNNKWLYDKSRGSPKSSLFS
ncbi:hypothetical protein K469DRAFT_654988 [Zopfia rhizophila CBS 207.26]|uniref:Nuclear pore complex component n=1 Tax=Zopfia rhizophila CBS 207.26 TaxID=1314779 RepID=A0A6A6ELK5_9PEZI|nr:hypothetical protein K469DRAFT_654988 [Zopfia rhizophila CBS 207.26]